MKGIETRLYDCLVATFHQTYPTSKLTIYFCVSSKKDPAYHVLLRLVAKYPSFDAKIFVEDEDPKLVGENDGSSALGPNPKIRNMSRAYSKAKGDIIWIIDCNVWVSQSVAGLMVDLLCGFGAAKGRKYKFVHQLPLVVDITHKTRAWIQSRGNHILERLSQHGGGLLEELFLSTAHAKFYTAISTVAIAPCTVGKSNMFRRSHLAALTHDTHVGRRRQPGIDFFSHNICEDHLIGDLLWKSPVPDPIVTLAALEGLNSKSPVDPNPSRHRWRNHALLRTPPCIQPVSSLPLQTYAARRSRWLRVRKFTVPMATLVEPFTESILATACGSFGLTTLPFCKQVLLIPQGWSAFWVLWVAGMIWWVILYRHVWALLQNWKGEGEDDSADDQTGDASTPSFVRSGSQRGVKEWLGSWITRELLAFPVWAWAVLGGTKVVWRGRRFTVGVDMTVHEVK